MSRLDVHLGQPHSECREPTSCNCDCDVCESAQRRYIDSIVIEVPRPPPLDSNGDEQTKRNQYMTALSLALVVVERIDPTRSDDGQLDAYVNGLDRLTRRIARMVGWDVG